MNPINLVDHNRWIASSLGMVLFGVLGSGVAHIWQETDRKKIFYLGIGLPALIAAAASGISNPSSAHPLNQTGLIEFLGGTVVCAQAITVAPTPTSLTLTLPTELRQTLVTAVFRNRVGEIVAATPITSERAIEIPEGATGFNLTSALGDSGTSQIPNSPGVLTGTVGAQPDALYGFWSVIGFAGKPYKIIVSDVKLSAPIRRGSAKIVGRTHEVIKGRTHETGRVFLSGTSLSRRLEAPFINGEWDFGGLPPGAYEATITVPGYRPLIWKNIVLSEGMTIEHFWLPLTRGDGDSLIEIVYPMATVHGTIRVEDGMPILSGTTVSVMKTFIRMSQRLDPSGAFTFDAMPIDPRNIRTAGGWPTCEATVTSVAYESKSSGFSCTANTDADVQMTQLNKSK